MTGYLHPVGDIYVPDDWQGHRDRKPPSTEPGTDYAAAYGTPVLAPADGFVVGVKRSNTGASGRALMINTSGDYHRALHLSSIPLLMVPGRRFRRGDVLAKSGASAKGSDWGTGAHVHWSFWRAPGRVPTPGVTPTQDFELYLQGEAPAGGGDSPLIIPSTLEEFDMDQTRVLYDEKGRRWALVGATVPALGASKPGAWVTRDNLVANSWALVHGNAVARTPEEFDTAVREHQKLAAAWVTQQKAIHA